MTLEQASKIVNLWGLFLEHSGGKLTLLFSGMIPESLAPFSKDKLEEAINLLAEHHRNNGNLEAAKTLQGNVGALTLLKDDEEALLQAARHFNDSGWRKTFLPALKQMQKNWIKSQEFDSE